MAGRCTECGTYHYDGPPCDECGAMGFQSAPKVMRCAECATVHRDESPPCKECRAMGFQRLENPAYFLDGDDTTGASTTAASGDLDDMEGYDVGSGGGRRRFLYGAGVVAVLGLGAYTVLSGDDHPTTEAPGEADEAAGIRFETVETEMRGLINDERESDDVGTLSTSENVGAFATYFNREYVKQGGGDLDDVQAEGFDGEFDVSGYYVVSNRFGNIGEFTSASALANECVDGWMGESRLRRPLTDSEYSRIGFDVHVDDAGDVFLLAVVD